MEFSLYMEINQLLTKKVIWSFGFKNLLLGLLVALTQLIHSAKCYETYFSSRATSQFNDKLHFAIFESVISEEPVLPECGRRMRRYH